MSPDRLARVALSKVFEPGDLRLPALLAHYGAADIVSRLVAGNDPRLHEASADVGSRLASVNAAADLERAAQAGIRFVTPEDDEWPAGLDDLDHIEPVQEMVGAPVGLWVRGPARLGRLTQSVAVVGARDATTYGCNVAAQIAGELVVADRPVVSGAAFGIDRAAHLGALSMRGTTVAVLACGVDVAYPVAHGSMLDDIARTGAVVSELPPGQTVKRQRFLSRNRLIAAFSEGVVVVEAAIRSGALNTATWADRLSRPVMAVPGPITSAQSQGAHELIRRGGLLVTRGAEVLEASAPMGSHAVADRRAEVLPRDRLTRRAKQVIDALEVDRAMTLEEVSAAAAVSPLDVAAVLQRAEVRGLVAQDCGRWVLTSLALRT
ncbi:DNA protecting protein DprA [Nocardioides baekrokdamisoli]|uniref:DNA protecting protein DprA n=1 Tax=Nocardioides baekrokdamisoli TaxID=1804624 RepID=A0A3G9J479_9ACTN|nr:DNA-processing protein DprA [Nocardioides baekrokdamisoli]BBH18224.1 DNA protecting protein DprA [Nocardioides baekrokdamisoli]